MKMTGKQFLQEKEFWLLALCILLFFYRPLFLGESFYYRDIYHHFLAQKRLLAEFIELREFPLWDKYLHGGQPYLADISNMALYPFNIVYIFLPFITAFNIIIVLHFIMCGIFSYIFSRVIELSPISSFIVGIVYSLCGLTLSLIDLQGFLFSMPYLPLTLLCWHLFFLKNQKRWFALTIIFSAVRVFAGAPELNILGMLLLLLWSFLYAYPSCSSRSKLCYWIELNLFVLGIAAIQIFPFFEMLMLSPRGLKGSGYAEFAYNSFLPRRLPELVFSKFFGLTDTIRTSDYWGTVNTIPFFSSVYYGGMVIFLAFSGAIYCRCELRFSQRMRLALLGIFLVSLVFSMGNALPFFHLIHVIPFMKLFRIPEKMLVLGIFPISILTGLAVELYFAQDSPIMQKTNCAEHPEKNITSVSSLLIKILWSMWVMLVIGTLLFLYSPHFQESLSLLFFKHQDTDISFQVLKTSFLHSLCMWTGMTLVFQFRFMDAKNWQHGMIAIIIAADIILSGMSFNLTVSKQLFSPSPILSLIVQHIGKGKFYREKNRIPILTPPANHIAWLYRWNLTVLLDHTAVFYRIPVIFHDNFNGLANTHVVTLKRLLESFDWREKIPIISAAGISMIMTEQNIKQIGIERIASFPNASNILFFLYENLRAVPPINVVHSWKYSSSDNDTIGMMTDANYDARNQAIIQLEQATSFFERQNNDIQRFSLPPASTQCQPATIQTIHAMSSSIKAKVMNTCDGYVVLPLPFYPGWKCLVDGQHTPIVRANFAFSASFLPAGEHSVTLVYHPSSVVLGGMTSFGASGLLLGIVFRSWRKKNL